MQDSGISDNAAAAQTVEFPEGVTAVSGGALIQSGTAVKPGDEIYISVDIPEGKELVFLTVNGVPVANGTLYTVGDEAVIINTAFADIPEESFLLQFPEGVVVTRNGQPTESGSRIYKDDLINIKTDVPEGLLLRSLTMNGLPIGDDTDVTVYGGDIYITAEFEADIPGDMLPENIEYTVSIPENVSVIRDDVILENGSTVNMGDILYIKAVAPEGMELESLTVGGAPAENGTYYTVGYENVVIDVGFGVKKLTLFVSDNVTVIRNDEILENEAPVNYGDELYIKAIAPEGMILDKLTLNGEAFENGTYYTVTADSLVIEALFAPETREHFTLSFAEGISVARDGELLENGAEIYEGDVLEISADVPEDGTPVNITVNGEGFENGASFTVGTADVDIAFADDSGDEQDENAELTIVFPENIIVINGELILSSGDTVESGNELIITAGAPEGMVLSSLTVNGEEFTAGDRYTVGGENVVIEAFFEEAKEEPANTAYDAQTEKTVSLNSELEGMSGGTRIFTRMSFFPGSSSINLTNTSDAYEVAQEAVTALEGEIDAEDFYSFDISIHDEDRDENIHKLEEGFITFRIPIPDDLADHSGKIKVYHLDGDTPELLVSEEVLDDDGVRKLQFTSSEFSPFMFAVDVSASIDGVNDADLTAQDNGDGTATYSTDDSDEDGGSEDSEDKDGAEDTKQVPVIKVTLPTMTNYIFNPYRLKVKVNEEGEESSEEIVSEGFSVINQGNCKVDIYMNAVVKEQKGSFEISDDPDFGRLENSKAAFIYIEAGKSDGNGGYTYADGYTGADGQIIVRKERSEAGKIMSLDSPEAVGGTSVGQIKIKGRAGVDPDNAWSESDTADILLTFRIVLSEEQNADAAQPESTDSDEQPDSTEPENTNSGEQPDSTQPENTDSDEQPASTEPENTDSDGQPDSTQPENTDNDEQPDSTEPENTDNDERSDSTEPESSDSDEQSDTATDE